MPKVKTNRQQAFTGSLKPGRNICTCPCAHCRDEMSRVRAAATSTKGCPHIGAQSSLLFCTLSSTLPICGSSTKLSSRLGDSNICMSQVGVNRSFKKQKKKKTTTTHSPWGWGTAQTAQHLHKHRLGMPDMAIHL